MRVLFTAFAPAVKLGLELNYPLDTIKEMMTLALWKEAKAKHSTINLISLVFGKSTRTLKSLSARYNKGHFFEHSETNLCRQIEDLLQRRPMDLDELSKRLPSFQEFDGAYLAVQMLIREGRISEIERDGRVMYTPIPRHHNLFSDDWEVRIDALSEHLEVIAETLRRRYLESRPDEQSAARTFTFQARPEDIEEFREELLEFIREKTRALEERAEQQRAPSESQPEQENFSLYLGVTPTPDHD
jgi:predicted transcriptional regulator